MIAGFYPVDGGEIRFGERRVDGLPPYARNIGMVFQNYALWPHMTVRANVTYGLGLRRLARDEVARRLQAGLRKVNLAGLEDRYPGQLSGGQQQRVALARALVLNPDILLLDEPLSNLDAKIRVQVRAEIRKLQKDLGITTVYVTHDQEEALSLSDRVAVMRDGRVQQVAPPKALYERPANRFVADFVGTNNFIPGVVKERAGAHALVETALGPVRARPAAELAPGAACVLAVRPENVALDGAVAAAPARRALATALPALGVALIWAFLAVFLVYPLLRVFYDAFSDEAGRLTLANFTAFAGDAFYRRSLWNSLVLGAGTVAATSVLGFAIALLLVRYDFPGRGLFGYLTLIPIISPPLVGVLGFTFIMGKAGTVNILLEDWFGLAKPINFVYGVHGVLLVETLHLFSMITLNVVDALGKIDPSLEEAAESVGARGWRKLRTITLPLTTPGDVAGALLVFIWTFSDFATPLVLGVHDLLASQ